ncbi:MAG: AAA family ATPase [Armatimonadetes bacterium]|nr:AAA family ATPase [Armatimonadota bacterium]MDE2206684.1 AAA family ATPase [Armatimonadota bacterium]
MDLMDLADAAALVHVSAQTLRNYIREGQLTSYPSGRRLRVDRAELESVFARVGTPEPAVRGAPRIFSVCNHKGGVGKTTTASTLAWLLAERGPTLMIDADPQAHLTQVYGIDSDKLEKTLYEILVKGMPIQEVMQPVANMGTASGPETSALPLPPSLYIVGSNLELADTTLQVTGRPWWVNLLRNALKPILPEFDYVVIDCPPSLDAITCNAIAASTDVIVPVDMGAFSLRGTVKLLDIVRHVAEQLPEQPTHRFLACRVESNQFSDDVLDQLWRHYGSRVYHTVIRKAVDVSRAQMYRQPLPALFPNNPATQDYEALVKEILDA